MHQERFNSKAFGDGRETNKGLKRRLFAILNNFLLQHVDRSILSCGLPIFVQTSHPLDCEGAAQIVVRIAANLRSK